MFDLITVPCHTHDQDLSFRKPEIHSSPQGATVCFIAPCSFRSPLRAVHVLFHAILQGLHEKGRGRADGGDAKFASPPPARGGGNIYSIPNKIIVSMQ